tara:strand:- start:1375 stop:3030 length:1656 start_codon:yes stop_codon:yes gene_type:complete
LLSSLLIKNYALIEEVNLRFEDGFTVITGETGAGKSILLGALGLILGNRADLGSIGDPETKCIIEAQFNIAQYQLQQLFKDEDLDYEPQTIIRREILPSGKSRAFINDTPVTLSQLSSLAVHLVDIHSQHQTLEVTSSDFQFKVLDAYAENTGLLASYGQEYARHLADRRKLADLKAQRAEAIKEEEYKNFLLNELLEANLKPGEQEDMEAGHEALNNVEQITEALGEAHQKLSREELGINDMLLEVKRMLSRISGFGEKYKNIDERIKSVGIELDDITQTIEDLAGATESDPEELARLESRLKLFFDLQKKHNVASVEELIEIRDALDDEVQSLQGLDSAIENLEKAVEKSMKIMGDQAEELSLKRKKTIPGLTIKLQQMLADLGMPNASFHIGLVPADGFRPNGKESLSFLFSANKGMRPQELKKAASGGELSRIMLSIKAILSEYENLPTLIFDEIDTGVSGEIALKMGIIMKKMAARMQVMSITHLPQIAGQGNHHYKVFKQDGDARTTTSLVKLDEAGRIDEIAEMLGGKATSTAAMEHAKQLLNN